MTKHAFKRTMWSTALNLSFALLVLAGGLVPAMPSLAGEQPCSSYVTNQTEFNQLLAEGKVFAEHFRNGNVVSININNQSEKCIAFKTRVYKIVDRNPAPFGTQIIFAETANAVTIPARGGTMNSGPVLHPGCDYQIDAFTPEGKPLWGDIVKLGLCSTPTVTPTPTPTVTPAPTDCVKDQAEFNKLLAEGKVFAKHFRDGNVVSIDITNLSDKCIGFETRVYKMVDRNPAPFGTQVLFAKSGVITIPAHGGRMNPGPVSYPGCDYQIDAFTPEGKPLWGDIVKLGLCSTPTVTPTPTPTVTPAPTDCVKDQAEFNKLLAEGKVFAEDFRQGGLVSISIHNNSEKCIAFKTVLFKMIDRDPFPFGKQVVVTETGIVIIPAHGGTKNPGPLSHPGCDYQIDAFTPEGKPLWGNIQKIGVCSTPTVTPTPTPTATPTPTVVVQSKGLSVQKTDNHDVTRPGHTLTYTITVKNTGDVDINDVKVIDYVPSYLTVTSIEGGGTRDGNLIIWEGLHLNPNETGTLRYTVKVNDDAPNAYVLNNRVVATSKDRDLRSEVTDTTMVERPGQVASVVSTPVPITMPITMPISVPITAKTGAEFTGILSTLLGGSGLALIVRRRIF